MSAMQIQSSNRKSLLELHGEAVSIARDIKGGYLAMFEVLLQIESRQAYYEFDVPSLKIYCVELLELSNSVANDFVIVVRKALEVPQLADAIRAKRTTISKVRKVCPVITPDNHKGWIELATHCSTREVERTVAMANPREAVHESMKYVASDLLEFKLGVSEEWRALLERTKDLLSQKERRAVSSEEALFVLMSDFCRRNDPVEKAKRAAKRSGEKANNEKSAEQARRTRYRPASVEHAVDLRDGGQCTYVNKNGRRCESRRWLEKHHVDEFARGGEHTVENIVTMCTGHHKVTHRKVVPFVT